MTRFDWFVFGMVSGIPIGSYIWSAVLLRGRRRPRPELSSDYNASLPDWPKAPMSLTSRNTIKFLTLMGLALLFMLAYAASR